MSKGDVVTLLFGVLSAVWLMAVIFDLVNRKPSTPAKQSRLRTRTQRDIAVNVIQARRELRSRLRYEERNNGHIVRIAQLRSQLAYLDGLIKE